MNFVPFHALTNASRGNLEFLKYFDDYYNFVDKPEQVTLFPLLNGTHWIHDLLGAKGLNVYEPVGQVIKAASVDFFGLDSQNLHIFSLLVHTFNAVLLSHWLRMTASTSTVVSNMVAMLFWVHPLNVEVVGWLSAQNYLFAMSFSLLFVMYIESNWSLQNPAVSVALFLLAAFSKASAITVVPLAVMRLIQLHISPDNKSVENGRKKSFANLVMGIMPLVIANLGTVYSVHLANSDSEQQYPETTQLELVVGSFLRAAMTIVMFLQKALFPSDLSAHVQFPRFGDLQSIYFVNSPGSTLDPFAIISVSLLLGITAFFFMRLRHNAFQAIAWISFLLCWTPTAGILQHGDGSQFGANRYMMFPIAFGLAPLCASIFDKVYKESPRALCAAVFFVSLGYIYVGNCALITWRNDKALLHNCLKIDPNDLVCLRFYAEYVGNYESNHSLATKFRRREYDLISSSTGLSFNDHLYLGHLLLLFREEKAACQMFKEVYDRGLPQLGPRHQAENNYMMAKIDVVLCLVQEGDLSAAEKELATISDKVHHLRNRIKVSVLRTVENLGAYLDADSPKFKQPFYSEFLH